eukprot:615232-Alexandrium_andersonii.AAC.1
MKYPCLDAQPQLVQRELARFHDVGVLVGGIGERHPSATDDAPNHAPRTGVGTHTNSRRPTPTPRRTASWTGQKFQLEQRTWQVPLVLGNNPP